MKEEKFILTNSQKGLDVKLKNFLKGTERIFLITGKPGVGKTTMTKVCLKKLIEKDIKQRTSGSESNVAGITLSHKAKNVLNQHIPNVFTFASAYGMKEVIHEDGSRTFEYNRFQEDIAIGECSIPVFVHDEVSQYTAEMLKIVLEKTPMFSKIIFMGDKAQLPPIDSQNKMEIDQDSPVFDLDLPEDCQHELTERVRQSEGNPILDLTDVIREEIFGSQNIKRVLECLKEPKIVDGRGYDFISYSDLQAHIENKDVMNTCVIAFRNKTVNFFNQKIRSHLLNNPDEEIIENDIICMLDNFYKMEGSTIEYVLFNSDVYKIGKVYTKNIRYVNGDKVYKIEVYVGNILNQRSKKELIVPTTNGRKDLELALKELSDKCRAGKMRWPAFWDFKKKFCNCTYGYAITAYKAQGSTYDSVYVDINDILLTKPLTPKRKLQTIYTAFTRAKYNVHVFKGRL